ETPPDEPPPPEPPPPLPQLAIQLDTVAPPIKASPVRKVKMRMQVTSFAPESEPQMQTMTFYASDLDSPPRLVNRPSATYPSSQLRRGVREGRVVLEVMIQSNGVVQVRRVLESSHEDFTKMARAFATRARFTSPQKDGRSVNAVFRWPLILRP
ncbi:MAG: TonB family protein, partial [Verrucomicrobiota bacterium]